MRYIYKIFHEKDRTQFEKEYQQRISFPTTILLGLKIKPQDQPNEYELYYVPTNKIISLVSMVQVISREIKRTFDALPPVAKRQFILECLVEELYNTNDLEGVRSTREEIARSAREVKLNKNSKHRFKSMIKSYMRLSNGDISLPKVPQDFRKIYDDITQGEIEDRKLPDGDIFRKDVTFILKKSGSGKVIHTGLTPEDRIKTEAGNLIDFMDRDDIPMLIKVAVGHYFFGYIHPFYDGNGRSSRFISSMYLKDELGDIATLSVSRGCNKFRTKYLESFEITNSIRNKGEMNCFIEKFLSIILEALKEMISEMKEKYELMNIALEKIENEPKLENQPDKHRNIMFIIAQNYFFDSSKGITVRELSEESDLSEATIRKVVNKLLDLSLIEQTGKRPIYLSIKKQYFEN